MKLVSRVTCSAAYGEYSLHFYLWLDGSYLGKTGWNQTEPDSYLFVNSMRGLEGEQWRAMLEETLEPKLGPLASALESSLALAALASLAQAFPEEIVEAYTIISPAELLEQDISVGGLLPQERVRS